MMRCLFLLILGCMFRVYESRAQSSAPSNLSEAITYFRKEWPQGELDSFRRMPEAQAVAREHYSSGSWIRSTWIRGNTPLAAYFDSLGVTHPDDMSAIILTSLHRTLNKKDPALAAQVTGYKEYWKSVGGCDDSLRTRARAVYGKFDEGDSITIYFPVDTAYGRRNAVVYNCPRPAWTFDSAKDLIVKGTIVRKFTVDNESNFFFEILITGLSRPDTPILYDKVAVGGMKKLALYSLRIE